MRRLHQARVIGRRNEPDDRDRDRKNKPLPHMIVSNAERHLLLHGLRAETIDGRMRNGYADVVKRKFHVTLLEHDEGVSVSCPELPGCHSQGANVEEALANIEEAIRGYIDLYGEPDTRCEIREMEVVTA